MLLLLGVLMIIIGYLIGAIPFGYVIGRLGGVNLLESGSGRTGGTNVLRALGLWAALFTILGDAFKGLIPTFVAASIFTPLGMSWVAALIGVATVLGHNYSIYLKFRGGAGGVTALGALAGLNVPIALIASFVAIAAISISRFASMATFSGSLAGLIGLILLTIFFQSPAGYILYGVLIAALITWTLRPNFASIRAGTERKIGTPEKNIKTI